MIREFTEGRRILFFPVRWANAVARWIAGIHSKSGTVQITNTLSPGRDGSLSIDVDMETVASKVKSRLGFDTESPVNHSEVKNIVFDLVDGASIINSGRRISVNQKWLAQQVPSGSSSGSVSSDTPQAVADTASAGSGSQAARSDHVHNLNVDGSLEFDSGTLKAKIDSSGGIEAGTSGLKVKVDSSGGIESTSSGIKLKRDGVTSPGTVNGPHDATSYSGYNDTWTDGVYKANGSSATTSGVGVIVPICTGAAIDTWGTTLWLRYRMLTFDRFGRLYSVAAETKELEFAPNENE